QVEDEAVGDGGTKTGAGVVASPRDVVIVIPVIRAVVVVIVGSQSVYGGQGLVAAIEGVRPEGAEARVRVGDDAGPDRRRSAGAADHVRAPGEDDNHAGVGVGDSGNIGRGAVAGALPPRLVTRRAEDAAGSAAAAAPDGFADVVARGVRPQARSAHR